MAVLSTFTKPLIAITAALAIIGCQASQQAAPRLTIDTDLQQCINLAQEFRNDVVTNEAGNAATSLLPALPFLSTNRFHWSLAEEAETQAQIDEWVQLAASLSEASRRKENQSFNAPWPDTKLAQLSSCSQSFASSERYVNARKEIVTTAEGPKDHYNTILQWLGLYPLLRPIFKARIDKLHREEKRWFLEEENFSSPRVYGLNEQSTEAPYGMAEWFRQGYRSSSLGLPLMNDSQLAMLFELHAPQFEINTLGERDNLGAPVLSGSMASIDTSAAIAYTLPSYTRFNGTKLLQLNYVVWFPEREAVSPVDLFSGNIDSIIWRVTLDQSGQVLLYDSVHSCGCYHKYFLANDRLSILQAPLSDEPANIMTLSGLNTDIALRLVVSSNEHFIVGIKPLANNIESTYTLADYSALYALPNGQSQDSLFSPTGIIKGSERLERFTLWPTGIESVGAMRQWGTHATGFVDRQHFDDPALFDSYLRFNE